MTVGNRVSFTLEASYRFLEGEGGDFSTSQRYDIYTRRKLLAPEIDSKLRGDLFEVELSIQTSVSSGESSTSLSDKYTLYFSEAAGIFLGLGPNANDSDPEWNSTTTRIVELTLE